MGNVKRVCEKSYMETGKSVNVLISGIHYGVGIASEYEHSEDFYTEEITGEDIERGVEFRAGGEIRLLSSFSLCVLIFERLHDLND